MFRKVLFLGAFLVAVSSAAGKSVHTRFTEWVQAHDIKFINSAHESRAFDNWIENDRHIETTNFKNLTYTLGHNQFSGMDETEFALFLGYDSNGISSYGVNNVRITPAQALCITKCSKDCMSQFKLENDVDGYDITPAEAVCTAKCSKDCMNSKDGENPKLRGTRLYLGDIVAAESVDWVKAGAVTPVKNQGQCGSCWSFSTTGALEGAYFIRYGKLVSFSEQQLVSCDNRQHGGKDMGCNGGLMDNAFSWIEKNGGLCTEDAYPYTSGTTKSAGTCETSCTNVENSQIHSFADVPAKSDDDMMSALNVQPISIAIQADQKDFQLYQSGVFTGSCGTQLDHGVLVVGYGNMNGEDYYRVKNSWGTTWGDQGYIYLGRGKQYNNGAGQCGMLLQASYPTV
jgi:C1A family cysteine protease